MSRLLLHLSDLHFGRIQPGLPESLIAAARQIKPDVVVVSGDFTQRARPTEFLEARQFLERLPEPQIVVPGNHDVPLYNLYGRFIERLDRFRRYITEDLEPAWKDDEIAVFGVNTARSLTFKGGRINLRQIENLRVRLCGLAEDVSRIVVTHHPFELPAGFHSRHLVGSARAAFRQWASCGVDLLLCGHLHVADSTTTLSRYGAGYHHAIVVTAGTAISTRGRGMPNSFNAIRIENRGSVRVAKWGFDPERRAFVRVSDVHFERTPAGWRRTGTPASAV